jgi:hypothetical protein
MFDRLAVRLSGRGPGQLQAEGETPTGAPS